FYLVSSRSADPGTRPMKAEDLRLEEIISFSEGTLSFQGREVVLHSLHAFAQFRKDLVDTVSLEHTRSFLTRFGYFQGQADASILINNFTWDSNLELIKAGTKLHSLEGIARDIINKLEYDERSGKFLMELSWVDSKEAQEHLYVLGKSARPVCWILSGYFSGFVSLCLNKDIYFIENSCKAQGNNLCHATGKDVESWGDEIKPYLSYFKSHDIKEKIKKLTEQLKEKAALLKKYEKEIDALGTAAKPSFIEIHSTAYKRLLVVANKVAPYDSTILITGETGAGKEVIAKYVHKLSTRAKGPFIAVNCGALPESLLESELFGHKAGAFTGAVKDRTGLFEAADGGTVFLDEIGDISPAMQLKILRVLQEHEILRVGESLPRKVDIRVIAATNKDLKALIAQGKFREDLFYRLSVMELNVPPLRERKEDILPLARFFVDRLSKKLKVRNLHIDSSCIDSLQRYDWPGNVRELENVIERAAILSPDGRILPEHLPGAITGSGKKTIQSALDGNSTLEAVERAYIEQVLDKTGGNKAKAARILGIDVTTLWRKLKSK
ncbi:MAG: sigma-54-dependent Fis family transcriptional regulator, partial [Bacteroidetes bacterium]|nr:sigma-54-dependent Fis family transcriptional regulator [Bacteroidota bacterium]